MLICYRRMRNYPHLLPEKRNSYISHCQQTKEERHLSQTTRTEQKLSWRKRRWTLDTACSGRGEVTATTTGTRTTRHAGYNGKTAEEPPLLLPTLRESKIQLLETCILTPLGYLVVLVMCASLSLLHNVSAQMVDNFRSRFGFDFLCRREARRMTGAALTEGQLGRIQTRTSLIWTTCRTADDGINLLLPLSQSMMTGTMAHDRMSGMHGCGQSFILHWNNDLCVTLPPSLPDT